MGISAWMLGFSTTPLLAAWQVWTVPETRRVLREDPPEKRLAVELSAAGNEWESFQVLLRSDVPVSGVRLESGTFVAADGAAMPGARVVLYRQQQMHMTEQTLTQNKAWGDLNGAVDIWCPLFPLHDPDTAAGRLAQGEKIWTYTALCQRNPTPWWHIDFPLLNYRVPSWIAWRYQMCGLLYWGGMSFWQQVDDPWSDPKTLDRRKEGKGPLYNGEGTLVYPGRAVGYDGIAPSLRLKALRDGIEDFEYLAILARAGQTEAARKIVLPLAESWFHWQPDPTAYVTARSQLARLIETHAKKKSPASR